MADRGVSKVDALAIAQIAGSLLATVAKDKGMGEVEQQIDAAVRAAKKILAAAEK
jgi:hypothetical protein